MGTAETGAVFVTGIGGYLYLYGYVLFALAKALRVFGFAWLGYWNGLLITSYSDSVDY